MLAAARRHGALVTVHCENDDAIGSRTEALLAARMTQPKVSCMVTARRGGA